MSKYEFKGATFTSVPSISNKDILICRISTPILKKYNNTEAVFIYLVKQKRFKTWFDVVDSDTMEYDIDTNGSVTGPSNSFAATPEYIYFKLYGDDSDLFVKSIIIQLRRSDEKDVNNMVYKELIRLYSQGTEEFENFMEYLWTDSILLR